MIFPLVRIVFFFFFFTFNRKSSICLCKTESTDQLCSNCTVDQGYRLFFYRGKLGPRLITAVDVEIYSQSAMPYFILW